MDWQPIETAPKDGTMILFLAEGKACAGWYDSKRAPFMWAFVDDGRESLAGCCDHEMTGRADVNGYPENMPTHWMKLPEPPK